MLVKKINLVVMLTLFLAFPTQAEFFFDDATRMLMYRSTKKLIKVDSKNLKENKDLIQELKIFLGEKGYACLRANNFELSTTQLSLCEYINDFKKIDVINPTSGHCTLTLNYSSQDDNFFGDNDSPKECFAKASRTTLPDSLLKVMNPERKLTNINLSNQTISSKTYSERKQDNIDKCICNAYQGSDFCDIEKINIIYTKLHNCHKLPACESETSTNCNRLSVSSGFELSKVRDLVESAKEKFISVSPNIEIQTEIEEVFLKYKQGEYASVSENYLNKISLKIKDSYSKLFEAKFNMFLEQNGCNSNLDDLIKNTSPDEFKVAIDESVLSLIDQMEQELKDGSSTYESRSMLKYLKLLEEENNKGDFKTSQRSALGRLAPRLQWAYLWGDEQISEEDEKYVDLILTRLNSKEVEESLGLLNDFVTPGKWDSHESNNALDFLKNSKELPEIRKLYKVKALQEYSSKLVDNNQDFAKNLPNEPHRGDGSGGGRGPGPISIAASVGMVGTKILGEIGEHKYKENKDKKDGLSLRNARDGLMLKRIADGVELVSTTGVATLGVKEAIQRGGKFIVIGIVALVDMAIDSFKEVMEYSSGELDQINQKIKEAEKIEAEEVKKAREEKEKERILREIDAKIKEQVKNQKKHETKDIYDHVDPKQGKEVTT